jgi:hypothetical protein
VSRLLTAIGILVVALSLTGCYSDTSDDTNPEEALETASFASVDDRCYGDCAERAADLYDACRARGHSKARCGQLVYEGWRRCNDGCDGSEDCQSTCQDQGEVARRACMRRGVNPVRCKIQSRRLVAQCTRQVCQERVDILPCARRCKTRAYKELRRCMRRGGHPNHCGQLAGAHFDTCTERTCVVPSCDEIACPDGHHCVVDDGAPACVQDPAPRDCEELRCVEGTHCQMRDDAPMCVPNTCEDHRCPDGHSCELEDGRPVCVPNASPCEDVVCPDAHHCAVLDGAAACVPDRVESCPERCDRAAAAVYETCVERGENPDTCRAEAEHHAVACVRECPRPPETCDDVACPEDHFCRVMDGQAVCVPNRLQRNCEDVDCPERHHCHETDDGPTCARDHGCEDTICPDGTECRHFEGIAQCTDDDPRCQELCHARAQARRYLCEHHERRGVPACQEEADELRRTCAEHCFVPPTCDDVVCREGDVCQVRDGQVECVPEPTPGCDDHVCPDRHHCHATNNGPVCARDHGCEDTNCPDGWMCEEIQGMAQCSDGPLTCLQRCHRVQETQQYLCVYHEGRAPLECIQEATEDRAECNARCEAPSCDGVQCPDGETCQVRDGQVACVPVQVRNCGNTVCPGRHHCHETENGPVCARDHGCEDTICPEGSSCSELLGIAQCYQDEPTCTQWCYRQREARNYDCVHHHLRAPEVCAEEADHARARCVEGCQ